MIANRILILLLISSLAANFLMIREIYNINDQVKFLIDNNSQMRISTSFSIRPFLVFAKIINDFLDSFHNKEKFYIKKKNYGKIKENMKGAIVRELSISDRFLL